MKLAADSICFGKRQNFGNYELITEIDGMKQMVSITKTVQKIYLI